VTARLEARVPIGGGGERLDEEPEMQVSPGLLPDRRRVEGSHGHRDRASERRHVQSLRQHDEVAPKDDPVLVLTGAPGSGKTTVARLLTAQATRAVHVEADCFFSFITSGYVEPWKPESHEQNKVVMRLVGEAAAGYAMAGYLTVIDGIISPGWFLEPLTTSLRAAGLEVAYAVLRPALSIATERAARREASRLNDPEVIERLWRDLADLGPLEQHAIDNSTQTAEETSNLLADRLRVGELTL